MTGLILGAIIVLLIIWGIVLYNRLVQLRNNRENAFANIDVQLKQRYDLVPQLVAAVKGYATHEKELLERVTEARTAAMGASSINEKIAADTNLSNALAGLRVSLEAYPDLKANENFLQLQSQLEGTENRITVARNAFNDAAKQFNVLIRKFPNNLIASMCNFEKKAYFDAEEGAEKAPMVEF